MTQAQAEPPQLPDEGPDALPLRHVPAHQPQPDLPAQAEQVVAETHGSDVDGFVGFGDVAEHCELRYAHDEPPQLPVVGPLPTPRRHCPAHHPQAPSAVQVEHDVWAGQVSPPEVPPDRETQAMSATPTISRRSCQRRTGFATFETNVLFIGPPSLLVHSPLVADEMPVT